MVKWDSIQCTALFPSRYRFTNHGCSRALSFILCPVLPTYTFPEIIDMLSTIDTAQSTNFFPCFFLSLSELVLVVAQKNRSVPSGLICGASEGESKRPGLSNTPQVRGF